MAEEKVGMPPKDSEDEELQRSEGAKRRGVTLKCVLCYRWWTPILWVLALIAVALAIAIPVLLHTRPWVPDDPDLTLNAIDSPPFVPVDWLVQQMASEEGVTVLDAREAPSTFTNQAGLDQSIPGAVRARWQDFMSGNDLKSPSDIAKEYQTRGVFTNRPVVVYGGWSASNFWGEEARVWWHLHWLNHTQAYVLFGGIWAWDSSNHTGRGRTGETGDFTASPVASRLVSTAQVLEVVDTAPESVFVVDVRAVNEYNGGTPFGEKYGGHIGGAVSWPWRGVFDAGGSLRPLADIRMDMVNLGYQEGQRMIVYCTRGIRASFAVATLTAAGFQPTLYEGSWLEWSEQVPQEKSDQLQAKLG